MPGCAQFFGDMIPRRFFLLLFTIALAVPPPASAQFKWLRNSPVERLTGADRRQFDVLGLIMEDAERATDNNERARLLEEYLETSEAFVSDHPDLVTVWSGRVVAATELNRPLVAWDAGQELLRLRAERMDDMEVRRALAMLERRHWLDENPPQVGPRDGEPWQNSLGMLFSPVEGADAHVSVFETRVRDFTTFVEATGHEATSGMLSFGANESNWKRRGASWRLPGFDQSGDHPVVGVNWYDAKAFCAWLTRKEREEGMIAEDQEYRLPYDAEWSIAAGPDTYPWGEQWPPPPGAGNFFGAENLPSELRVLEGFNDAAPRTTRVGSFGPNRFGLHDLGGNVEEWCEDFVPGDGTASTDVNETENKGILRGSSWSYQNSSNLNAQRRHRVERDQRIDDVGFRCVLAHHTPPVTIAGQGATPTEDTAAGDIASAPSPSERTQPRPIHQVQPDFSPDQDFNSGPGNVVLEFTIDEAGRVRDPRVVSSSHPAFEQPALTAVGDWRFEPARQDGQPVACRAIQEFRFSTQPSSRQEIP